MSKLSDILVELRQDRGLTQKELADLIGISHTSISSYEIGKRMPNAEILIKLSSCLEVTSDYLLGLSSHDISPSALEEEYIPGIKINSIIQSMKALSQEQRKALIMVLNGMRTEADIKGIANKNEV